MVNTLPFPEYIKISDKSIAKSIFDSLCAAYLNYSTSEGSKEKSSCPTKWTIQKEDIEIMFSKFQTMVFGMQVLNKSYTKSFNLVC